MSTQIPPEVITKAAEAGERAARPMVMPPGCTSMCIKTGSSPAISYDRDRPAREAFAAAAIEVYQIWVGSPLKPAVSDTQHARAIVEIIGNRVLLANSTRTALTDHIEAYFTDKVSRPPNDGPHMEQLTQDLMKAMGERDALLRENQEFILKQQTLVQDRDLAKALANTLQEDLRLAAQERDAFKGELESMQRDQIRHAGMIDSLEKQKESLIKGGGWIKFEDRKPTIDDCDIHGQICGLAADGALFVNDIEHVFYPTNALWRPTNSPVQVPQFVKWKRTLTERQVEEFGGPYHLDDVWNSITSFIQTNPDK